MIEFTLKTSTRNDMIEITDKVAAAIDKDGVSSGLVTIFTPHTTAGITINENADPDVITDFLAGLDHIAPNSLNHLHAEGNSAAHIKSSLVGCSETIIIENGVMVLGTWQGIYFCEFDGPRSRRVIVSVMAQ